MFSKILFEIKDRIAYLTLNLPRQNNVITGDDIISEIESAVDQINQDESVSVLILSAKGKVFSAGGDLKAMDEKKGMFKGSPEELFRNYEKNVQRIPRAFYSLKVPSIAAVNGPASGAGCDLAFMCDMRIASENAWFSESFINVGLVPGDGGLFFLNKIANHPIIAEMVFTGKKIDAKRAFDSGLINYICKPEELSDKADDLAKKIASKPPKTIRLALKLLKQSYGMSLENVLYSSGLSQTLCHNTKDHKEAVRAFLEKREPMFKGE